MPSSPELQYPPESAGRLMRRAVPVVGVDSTLRDIEYLLRGQAKDLEWVEPVYVTDTEGRVAGVLSVQVVFAYPAEALVADLMEEPPSGIRPEDDQEKAALIALRENSQSVPVLDSRDKLLGAISTRALLQVLDSEAVEDLLKIGGIIPGRAADLSHRRSLSASILHRLPWLILGLFGGLLAAGIIEQFQLILTDHLVLVSFIPLVTYMAAAVSVQMSSFIIREMSLDHRLNFSRYAGRQSLVVLAMSAILSVILFLLTMTLYELPPVVSLAVAAGLFAACLSALLTGLAVPFIFYWLRFDPADASGPVATIIQDLLSVSIYLGVAWWLL